MKRRTPAWVLLILSMFLFNMCSLRLPTDILNREYIDALMSMYEKRYSFSIKHRDRIRDCIITYSEKYNIPTDLFARVIGVESWFKYNAYSSAGARGLCQVMGCWDYLLYHIDDGKLGKHLLEKGITDYRRYYYRIGYNCAMGAYILSHLKKKFGTWELALLFYNHGYSETFMECQKQPALARRKKYVRDVLGL